MNSPGFSADLTSFDLLDLVQVIHLDRHDLCLVLRAGSQTLGVLRFRQGELLWAEFGEMTGEAAFMALAAQQYGNLEQLPWTDTGERNVYQPLSRLIMQAVAYRDQQQGTGEGDAWGNEGWGQPQEVNALQTPMAVQPGNGYHPYPDGGLASLVTAEMEDEEMPSWMRRVSPSVEEIAAQPTGAMPLTPVPRLLSVASPPLSSADPHTPPSLPAAPTGDQAAQSTGSFSMLNGKRSLPGLMRSAPRNEALPASPVPEDPPTVPLPAVQGSLMDYALRRELPGSLALEEQGTKPLPGSESEPSLEPESFLDEEMSGRGATSILTALASAGSLATPAAGRAPDQEGAVASGAVLSGVQGEAWQERAPTPVLPAPAAAGPQPRLREPEGARLSSLSLLEQLAYGSARNVHAAEVAAPPVEVGLPVINPPDVSAFDSPASHSATLIAPAAESAVAESAGPPSEPALTSEPALKDAGRPHSRYISGSSPMRRSLISAPSPAHASAAVAGAEAGGGTLVWPLSAETTRKLQEAQEGFALQVGPAFLATAILRADGTLVAQQVANKRIEQDLSSPAYHLAHVMQSSLRALLMGGWGDLDETLITGSTHTVVLRRLGWAEKGLFHMAVLERSGNHGLCRVLMRNTEPILLQLLTSQ